MTAAPHRDHGAGTVEQLPSGRWRARLRYVDSDTGRQRRASVTADTRAGLRREVAETRKRLAGGGPARDSGRTFGHWLREWSDTVLPASPRRATTVELYRSLARVHLLPRLGDTRLDRLRASDVDRVVLQMRRAGLADSTVRGTYGVLRAILTDARRDGLVAVNVAEKVKRPAVAHHEAVYLNGAQVRAVVAAAHGTRWHAYVALLAATGLRRGEGLALRWADLDLDAGTARVVATLARVDGELLREPPKTDRSRRTVHLSAGMVELLRAQRARQAAERLAAGSVWSDHGLVFATEVGTPVDPRNALRAYLGLAKRAGVPGSLHSLRHSAAVAALGAGVDLRTVADSLGHGSVAVTGDLYGHSPAERQRAAADAVAMALGL